MKKFARGVSINISDISRSATRFLGSESKNRDEK